MNDIDPVIHEAITNMPVPDDSPGFLNRVDDMITAEPLSVVAKHPHRRVFAISGGLSLAAAIAAVALIVGAMNNGGNAPDVAQQPKPQQPTVTQIQPTLASDVSRNVVTAMRSLHAIKGDYTILQTPTIPTDEYPKQTLKGSFALDEKGNYFESVGSDSNGSGQTLMSFDATSGASKECSFNDGKWACVTAADDLSEPSFSRYWVSSAALANAIKDSRVDLVDATYDGKETWKLTFPLTANTLDPQPADSVSVMVDKKTNYPIDTVVSYKGHVVNEVSITNLVVNPVLTSSDLVVQTPKGAATTSSGSYIYKRTDLAGLRKKLGHDPVLPANVPDGFTMAEVMFVSDLNNGLGADWCGGADTNIAIVTYRKGLESFRVAVGDAKGASADCDPWGVKRENVFLQDETTLTAGAFAGVKVRMGAYETGSRLYGVGSRNSLSIIGDLSVDEFYSVANSIEAQKG